MKILGRECDLQNVAFVVAQMGYEQPMVKVSYTCKAADEDAQLMPHVIKSAKFKGNTSMIHIAAQTGNVKRVARLLAHGVPVEGPPLRYNTTPLSLAIRLAPSPIEVVRLLIENGADVNKEDYYKKSPLAYACEHAHADVVRLLVDRGANVHITTRFSSKQDRVDTLLTLVQIEESSCFNTVRITEEVIDKKNRYRQIIDMLKAKGAKSSFAW